MTGKVAIVSGASRGIGGGLVAGYRRQGWAVVTSVRTITPCEDPGVLTVTGGIAHAEIADRIIGGALRRFGRIDTLVNSAGVFIAPGVFARHHRQDLAHRRHPEWAGNEP
jgi:NAD(P)-dependent dehydrogenase (short-subunit alcohol dehydrogenase family)